MPRKRPELERFWEKVRVSDHCWTWIGGANHLGYGRFTVRHGVKEYAHRYSYRLHHGGIPPGLFVLHSCDNPACVNPDHLRIGTQADNIADAVARNRFRPWNSAKRACIRGHDFTEANTYRLPNGKRQCRACRRMQKRRVLDVLAERAA